jgi:hypothetical protein
MLKDLIHGKRGERGTLETQLAVFASSEGEIANARCLLYLRINSIASARGHGHILKSKQAYQVKLRQLSSDDPLLYHRVLGYCRLLWPNLHLLDDMDVTAGNAFDSAQAARRFNYIRMNSIRYSSAVSGRTQKDRFALVDFDGICVPWEIRYHFEISIYDKPPDLCSVVRRLVSDDDLPVMPWDLLCVIYYSHNLSLCCKTLFSRTA